MQRCHSELLPAYEKDKDENRKRRRLDKPKTRPSKSTSSIDNIFPLDKQKSISRQEVLLVDFVVKGMHPYSIVEEPGFRSYVQSKFPNL